jgi:hypothetical protein
VDPHGSLIPIVVIIRRDLARVAAHLRDELGGFVRLVAVIIDRRYGDRRRAATVRPVERRQSDRRWRSSVAKQLRDNGWAVVTRDDSTSKE